MMPLTDTECKNAKSIVKPFKLSDSEGLYLEVMPNGSKFWRLKYRFGGKEKRLALGKYPLLKLADARLARDAAKKHLLNKIDPSEVKRAATRAAAKQEKNTFKEIAIEWVEAHRGTWSKKYLTIVEGRLEKDIYPIIGKDNISKLEPPDLMKVLRCIEKRGALYHVKRVRQVCEHVFRFAIQIGKCKENPAIHLKGAVKGHKKKHFAAIETSEIPQLLEDLEFNKVRLHSRTIRAVKLSLLTFVRPGELRQAQWSEIDWDKKEWRIPAQRMKMRVDHIVPLSSQAIKILKLQEDETGHLNTDQIFPGRNNPSEAMSGGTVLVALQRLGYKSRMTAHGFRALARTAIREELDYEPDVIEVQLAHRPSGSLGAAYDRAKFIKRRHVMMQDWADYIEKAYLMHKRKILEVEFQRQSE